MHFRKHALPSAQHGDGRLALWDRHLDFPSADFPSEFPSGTRSAVAQNTLPEKLYRMAEVMDHTGLSRQTLHYYATLGLIREKRRTQSGYRLFAPTVFRDLERVKKLQNKGYTLREIRERVTSRRTNRG